MESELSACKRVASLRLGSYQPKHKYKKAQQVGQFALGQRRLFGFGETLFSVLELTVGVVVVSLSKVTSETCYSEDPSRQGEDPDTTDRRQHGSLRNLSILASWQKSLRVRGKKELAESGRLFPPVCQFWCPFCHIR